MNAVESLFPISDHTLTELYNPKWDEARRVHDWKNYVDGDIKNAWDKLLPSHKRIVAHYAEQRADAEEWD